MRSQIGLTLSVGLIVGVVSSLAATRIPLLAEMSPWAIGAVAGLLFALGVWLLLARGRDAASRRTLNVIKDVRSHDDAAIGDVDVRSDADETNVVTGVHTEGDLTIGDVKVGGDKQ